jgi:hypothetical protein
LIVVELRAAIDLRIDLIGAVLPTFLCPASFLAKLGDDTAHMLATFRRQ